MFPDSQNGPNKFHLLSIIGLSLLSASALAVTIWTMVDFISEQALVEQLIRDLPEARKVQQENCRANCNGNLGWRFWFCSM